MLPAILNGKEMSLGTRARRTDPIMGLIISKVYALNRETIFLSEFSEELKDMVSQLIAEL